MAPSRKICTLDAPARPPRARPARRAGRSCTATGASTSSTPGTSTTSSSPRALGDVLVVSVSADTHVNKGVNRPLIPDDLRAASLAALECVDCVYVNPDPTAVELLEAAAAGRVREGPRVRAEQRPALPRRARRGHAARRARRVLQRRRRLLLHRADRQRSARPTSSRTRSSPASASGYDLSNAQPAAACVAAVPRAGGWSSSATTSSTATTSATPTGVAGEGPMLSLRSLQRTDYDGGAGVVALHLAGLGRRPVLVGVAGGRRSCRGRRRCGCAAAGVDVAAAAASGRTSSPSTATSSTQTKLFKVDEGVADAARLAAGGAARRADPRRRRRRGGRRSSPTSATA